MKQRSPDANADADAARSGDQADHRRRPADRGDWRRAFHMMRMAAADPLSRPRDDRRDERAWYRLNVGDSQGTQVLVVEVYRQRRRADGTWGRLTAYPLGRVHFCHWPRTADRELVALLEATAPQLRSQRRRYVTLPPREHRSFVPALLHDSVLPRLCATGRFFRSRRRPSRDGRRTSLKWRSGPPWTFAAAVEIAPAAPGERGDDGDRVRLTGRLRRSDEGRAVTEPEMLIDGCVLDGDTLAGF